MKKFIYLLSLAFSPLLSNAQGSAGLVGHWNFNGSTNDVSGNGLNGIATGAIPVPGYSGAANTAYKFSGSAVSGVVDHILVPYNSLMNVQKYSICALVKFDEFSSDHCQTSSIFWRGTQGSDDYYSIYINDNPYDSDCAQVNKSKVNFMGDHGNLAWVVPNSARKYTSYVSTGNWYCVTSTYDGDSIRLYLDGTLYKTVGYTQTLNPGIEDMRFGASMFTVSNTDWHSYPLYGSIDDIRFYNRALGGNEVAMYCDSAKGKRTDDGGGSTDWPTSVNSIAEQEDFVLAPNPAGNNIRVVLPRYTTAKAQLVSSIGQIVAEQTFTGTALQFDLSNYPAGLYMVRLNIDGHTSVRKFIKE